MVTLADFAGRWRLLRAIRHADGGRARLAGEAVWTRDGAGLRSVETGRLETDGAAFEARRETFWRQQPGGIAIAFMDGRPFHVIGPGPRVTADHACAPDSYALAYDFSAWPCWSVRWRVVGPRKAYRALSRYAPL